MSLIFQQSTPAKATMILASSGTPVTGVVFGDVTAYLSKNGAAPIAYTVDGSNFAELSAANMPGLYTLTLNASALDTLGELILHVSGGTFDVYVTRITVEKANLSKVNDDLATVDSVVDSNAAALVTIDTVVDNNATALTTIDTVVDANAAALTTIDSVVDGNATALATIDTVVDGNATSLASLTTAVATVDTVVDGNATAIADVQTAVDGNTTLINSVKTTTEASNVIVTDVQGTVNTIETDLGAVTTAVDNNTTQVNAAKASVDALSADVTDIQSTVNTIETDVTAVTTAVGNNTTQVNAAKASVDALAGDVTNIDATTTDIETALALVSTSVTSTQTAVTSLSGAGFDAATDSLEAIRDTIDARVPSEVVQKSHLVNGAGNLTPPNDVGLWDVLGDGSASISSIALDTKRMLGLSQENYAVTGQTYDSNNNLISAVIRIYESKGDLETNTNPFATYVVSASYDSQNRLITYQVGKQP